MKTLVLLITGLWMLTGCTDRVKYKHSWVDEKNQKHTVEVVYSEGIGNQEKEGINVTLPDQTQFSTIRSITNQDKFMETMTLYGDVLSQLSKRIPSVSGK